MTCRHFGSGVRSWKSQYISCCSLKVPPTCSFIISRWIEFQMRDINFLLFRHGDATASAAKGSRVKITLNKCALCILLEMSTLRSWTGSGRLDGRAFNSFLVTSCLGDKYICPIMLDFRPQILAGSICVDTSRQAIKHKHRQAGKQAHKHKQADKQTSTSKQGGRHAFYLLVKRLLTQSSRQALLFMCILPACDICTWWLAQKHRHRWR